MKDRQSHWNAAYAATRPEEVSWHQPVPEKSLEFILETGLGPSSPILDVGGGASTLVDNLLDKQFESVSVLDVSAAALKHARTRLGSRADHVAWIESDITRFVNPRTYALWHDRAVFHFLTDHVERDGYIDVLRASLEPRGHFLLATFGPDGPVRCSGLDVRRYSIAELQELLAADFELRRHEIEVHLTPRGFQQQFLYSWWQLKGGN